MVKFYPSSPRFPGLLSWRDVGFCERSSLHQLRQLWFFVPCSIYVLYYAYLFAYTKLPLNPWNETNLIMWGIICLMYVEFDLQYYIENFFYLSSSKKLVYKSCLLACFVLILLWCQDNTGFLEYQFWSISSTSSF
jgi:hypothetical protein